MQNLLYSSDIFDHTQERVLDILRANCRKRRLEKGLSRVHLANLSGVPAPTIAKFETTGKISLESFVKIVLVFDGFDDLSRIMSRAKYSTMEELEVINANLKRKKGR